MPRIISILKRLLNTNYPLLIGVFFILFFLGCGDFQGLDNFGNSGKLGFGSGSVTLAWQEPTVADNAIAGFIVYYGASSQSYTEAIDVGRETICTIGGLPPGNCYFVVTAYDSTGNESGFSNEVSTVID